MTEEIDNQILIKIEYNEKIFEEPKNTTPFDFSKKHNPKHAEAIVSKINDELFDLKRPMTKDSKIKFLTFEDDEGKEVFWHSSAHILGYALLQHFPGCKLSSGPPTEEGFYYDIKIGAPIKQEDYVNIENEIKKIIKKNYSFERKEVSKNELLEHFAENPFKLHYINKNVEERSTVYKIGNFTDFCLGPHVVSTGIIKNLKIVNHGASYFLGKATEESLQRVYGISFPTKEKIVEYFDLKEKAKKRDHRKIGLECNLFFFHKYSPGSCFFLPDGTHIYNTLMSFLRDEYKKRGYQEVITPNMFSTELWQESGHLSNYKENMFLFDVDSCEYALKPMNCPGHCVMFNQSEKSFRELPLRLADFGVLHRNELSGTLTGLTRVRRFQQDDAHIFCRRDQIEDEIRNCLEFLEYVYKIFNFTFELRLSTRPEKYIGELEDWNEAENKLKAALTALGHPFVINEGDGAFYGPKIDIILFDALKRRNQCATIQLDFQLPLRFNLKYKCTDGTYQTPVMIHRALLGSIERMMAIIIESFGKKLPFWLSPKQIAIIPINADEYAAELKEYFGDFKVTVFDEDVTLSKKILRAETQGFNMIFVVGEKEKNERTVCVRSGKNEVYKICEMKKVLEEMKNQKKEFLEIKMLLLTMK